MKIVEPIREKNQIEAIKKLLLADGKVRDLLLFELGINSALRITDLLSLKVWDVFDSKWKPVQKFTIKESKTNKTNEITIVNNVKETLLKYKQAYPDIIAHSDYYLFFQEKNSSKKEWIWEIKKWQIAIKRRMAEYLITKRCDSIWLQWNYWTHTLRKTRWYFAYTSKYSMELIQKKLNHSSPWTTLRYIGITSDDISNMCIEMNL
jgi:integrase